MNVEWFDERDLRLNGLSELETELDRKNVLTLDLTIHMVRTGAIPSIVASNNRVEAMT